MRFTLHAFLYCLLYMQQSFAIFAYTLRLCGKPTTIPYASFPSTWAYTVPPAEAPADRTMQKVLPCWYPGASSCTTE